MSLNSTPLGERVHIGIFGNRNAGKSSIINALTGQNTALVSATKGTTTDPVYKSMELLPIGPITLIDTAGFDDEGELGLMRIEKTKQILNKTDIALLVVDSQAGLNETDLELISIFKSKNIKYIIVYNKSDIFENKSLKENEISVSAVNNKNINELKELIASVYEKNPAALPLVKDLVNPNDIVIMVTPIDSAAPKGRIILPQQQVLRDLLEGGAITITVREHELPQALNAVKNKPKLIITDSQAFKFVNANTPADILLTSFSILFARYKGVLDYAVKGVKAFDKLNDNDTILISEGCTHHRQCDDIGSVKLPNWIKNYTGKNLNFEFTSGGTFPSNLTKYKLIVHCGSCMLKDIEVIHRYQSAASQNIPITNYGIAIAYLHNILKRSVEIFPEIYKQL